MVITWYELPPELHWETSEAVAVQKATTEHRPMLVDFGASWCGACKELDEKTFPDPKVMKEGSRFVALHVDASNDDDPAVEKGFNFLAESIGKPLGSKKPRGKNRAGINFYLLWSIERCGVLFNRRETAGKDWYPWGAELLLDHQGNDGSWKGGTYPAAIPIADTCFALLFLKRANLAKDLTKKLEFFREGKKLHGP